MGNEADGCIQMCGDCSIQWVVGSRCSEHSIGNETAIVLSVLGEGLLHRVQANYSRRDGSGLSFSLYLVSST